MYKVLQLKTLFILSLFFVASCAPSAPTPTSAPVATLANLDEEMTLAVRQAQDTLYILRQAMLAPKPSYKFLSVKVRFASNGDIEDMWTEPIDFSDSKYTVRLVEGVTLELGAHPDRLIEVAPRDVLDWMILEKDGSVFGGYTLRIEYQRMTPDQQKRYDEVTGYKFEKQ
ncbi:MAG TPA: DUF2314 domain-containing protein [Anaerolineales bacterium]|nr:DUF2314 domain-containing protein [Anaerolineales bacterium]